MYERIVILLCVYLASKDERISTKLIRAEPPCRRRQSGERAHPTGGRGFFSGGKEGVGTRVPHGGVKLHAWWKSGGFGGDGNVLHLANGVNGSRHAFNLYHPIGLSVKNRRCRRKIFHRSWVRVRVSGVKGLSNKATRDPEMRNGILAG